MTKTISPMTNKSESLLRKRLSIIVAGVMATVIALLGTFFNDSELARQDAEDAQAAAEKARDAQLRRAELIIVSAPVALIMCGEDRKITICNPKAEEMFGWKQTELLNQKIDILLPDSFISRHEKIFATALSAAKSGPDNYMIRRVGVKSQGKHRDGRLFDVEVSIRVIKYGGRVEFIASVQSTEKGSKVDKIPLPDITARRDKIQNAIRQRVQPQK